MAKKKAEPPAPRCERACGCQCDQVLCGCHDARLMAVED